MLDRNGNGQIDNGGELFGVDTVKANGQKATDGFDALRDFDSNGDGVFDAKDAQFANVRVWQDTNQDGIAQAGELKTLAEHNIVAINLDSTASNQASNGNLISATGTFIRGDGTQGSVNANQSVVANLDLASNPFYREFTDPIALDDAAKALPDMKGSGAVRDLREASMLNAELKTLLTTYSQAQTREEQMGLLDKLIAEWAKSANYQTFDKRIDALDEGSTDVRFQYSWEASGTPPTEAQQNTQKLLERVKALEVFNAQNIFRFGKSSSGSGLTLFFGIGANNNSTTYLSSQSAVMIDERSLALNGGQTELLNNAYNALKQSIYDGLLFQTRLKPLMEAIDIHLDANSIGLTLNHERTAAIFSGSSLSTAMDMLELSKTDLGKQIADSLFFSIGKLLPTLSVTDHALIKAAFPDFLFGTNANDQLTTSGLITNLIGGDGNDKLIGAAGNTRLYGGEGNDTLKGGYGNDTLIGGSGDDQLHGNENNDVLHGGTGNDSLFGGAGDDTYLFNLGDGHDTIQEYGGHGSWNDVLRFGEGIHPQDIIVRRDGTNLVLEHINGADKVTVEHWFYNGGVQTFYQLDRIEFADGSCWQGGDVSTRALRLEGTAADDTLIGVDNFNNVLLGLQGNDTLKGGYGNDTYVFGKGDGQDVISDIGGSDTLLFGQDISTNDLWLQRTGNNLELSVLGSDDKVTISNWYASASNHVETIKTADGKTLLDSQVQNLANAMAAFAPPTAGNSNLTPEQRAQLEVVIAANWH